MRVIENGFVRAASAAVGNIFNAALVTTFGSILLLSGCSEDGSTKFPFGGDVIKSVMNPSSEAVSKASDFPFVMTLPGNVVEEKNSPARASNVSFQRSYTLNVGFPNQAALNWHDTHIGGQQWIRCTGPSSEWQRHGTSSVDGNKVDVIHEISSYWRSPTAAEDQLLVVHASYESLGVSGPDAARVPNNDSQRINLSLLDGQQNYPVGVSCDPRSVSVRN